MKAGLGFRQGRRLTLSGARMALAAIAFHLVLSFIHIHPWTFSAQAVSAVEAPDGSPASDAPFEPVADGYCAVCANVAAFASLDLPGSIKIARVAVQGVACVLFVLSLRPERPTAYRLFQTRAPPSPANLRPL